MHKPNHYIDATDTDHVSNDTRRRGIGLKAGIALIASATGVVGGVGGYLIGHAGKNTGNTTSVVQFQTPAQQLNYDAILALAGQVERKDGLKHTANANGTETTTYKASPDITVDITSGPLGKTTVTGVETDVYYGSEELVSVVTTQTNQAGDMAQMTETFSGGQGDLDIESNSRLVENDLSNNQISTEQFALITNVQTLASLSLGENSYLDFGISNGQINLMDAALGTPGAINPTIARPLPGAELPADFYIG